VYISLGLTGYSPWKFVISTFVGKPFIDKFGYNDTIEPFNVAISVIISISIAIVIIYTFVRVDIDKVIRKYFPRAFEDEKTE
jgi:hypothetical protein